MNGIRGEAVVFETSYADRPAGNENAKAAKTKNWLPEFCGIDIRNVVCRDCRIAVRASGSVSEIHDITISDSVFFYDEKGLDAAPGMLKLKGVRMVTWP